MTGAVANPQARHSIDRDTRRTQLTAVFAVAASLGMMLLASPGTVSPLAYWTVSSIGLVTVLIVIVASENAWEQWVDSARAAGVVGS